MEKNMGKNLLGLERNKKCPNLIGREVPERSHQRQKFRSDMLLAALGKFFFSHQFIFFAKLPIFARFSFFERLPSLSQALLF